MNENFGSALLCKGDGGASVLASQAPQGNYDPEGSPGVSPHHPLAKQSITKTSLTFICFGSAFHHLNGKSLRFNVTRFDWRVAKVDTNVLKMVDESGAFWHGIMLFGLCGFRIMDE